MNCPKLFKRNNRLWLLGNKERLNFTHKELLDDPFFMTAAIGRFGSFAFTLASKRLQNDPKFIHEILLYTCVDIFKYVAALYENDKAMIKHVLSQNPAMFQYLAPHHQDDLSVATEMITNLSSTSLYNPMEHVTERLKSDMSLVRKMIRISATTLSFLPKYLCDVREIILEAIQYHPHALKYASLRLRCDREIVYEAVNKCPNVLIYACDELQKDSELVFLLEQYKNNLMSDVFDITSYKSRKR